MFTHLKKPWFLVSKYIQKLYCSVDTILITCNKFLIDGGGYMRKIHYKSSFALLTGGVAVRKIICNHRREEVNFYLMLCM